VPKEQPLAAALKAIQAGAQEILVREAKPSGQEGQTAMGPLLILGAAAVIAILLTMRRTPYPTLPSSASGVQRDGWQDSSGDASSAYSALSSLR